MKEKVNEKIKDLQIKLGKFLKVGFFFFFFLHVVKCLQINILSFKQEALQQEATPEVLGMRLISC